MLVNGVRQGRDPVTGQTVPAVMIGAFVPGTGDPSNGMVLDSDDSYPNGFRDQPGLIVEPRFGASYDLRGDGKTALRASVGIFHNTRQTGNTNWTASRNPPLQFNPTLYYGTLAGLAQSSTVLFPSDVQGFVKEMDTPVIYSFTAGVQRDLGWNTVFDAAYVGSRSRDLLNQKNINKVPYGARFLPQNLDPTLNNTPLTDNFFRPYPGYGNITLYGNFGIANYDALQMQVTRRFSGGFQFGFSYTLSQAKDYASTDTTELPTYQDLDAWSYGLTTFDQTHVAVINYTWDLPDASKMWNNKVVAALLDGWQLSGITAFASGTPPAIGATGTTPTNGFTLQNADNVDLMGGGDGTRLVMTGDPTLSGGDRSLDRWFDTSVFRRAARGEIGNAGKDVIRLPGTHVWDMTIFKNVSLGARRTLQLRWEAYNVFNHTQFNARRSEPALRRGGQSDERELRPRHQHARAAHDAGLGQILVLIGPIRSAIRSVRRQGGRYNARMELRVLTAGDEERFEQFLTAHRDTSMLLRSNARRAGLVYEGAAFQSVHVGAFQDDALTGVAAHAWTGLMLFQAPLGPEAVAALARACAERQRTQRDRIRRAARAGDGRARGAWTRGRAHGRGWTRVAVRDGSRGHHRAGAASERIDRLPPAARRRARPAARVAVRLPHRNARLACFGGNASARRRRFSTRRSPMARRGWRRRRRPIPPCRCRCRRSMRRCRTSCSSAASTRRRRCADAATPRPPSPIRCSSPANAARRARCCSPKTRAPPARTKRSDSAARATTRSSCFVSLVARFNFYKQPARRG